MHWHGGQCLRRLIPNYAVVFRLAWAYLPQPLCHRRSRRRWLFLRGTFCFFSLSVRSRFLWFYQSIRRFNTFPKGISTSTTRIKTRYQCCIAVIHIQPYTYTCGNKINNNNERTHIFRKIYLSHFFRKGCERVVCERWVGDWTDCNILTPSSSDYSSTSFSFCWAAQPGSWGPSPLLGAGSHCLELQQTDTN